MVITALPSVSKSLQGYILWHRIQAPVQEKQFCFCWISGSGTCTYNLSSTGPLEVTKHHRVSPAQCFRCLRVCFWYAWMYFNVENDILYLILLPPKCVSAQYDLRPWRRFVVWGQENKSGRTLFVLGRGQKGLCWDGCCLERRETLMTRVSLILK